MKKRTQSYLQQTYDEALLAACESGDAERVRAALKDGANPNRNRSVDGYSPLSAAIYGALSSDCVRLLLEAGADANEYAGYDGYRLYTAFDFLIRGPFDEPTLPGADPRAVSHESYLSASEEHGAAFREVLNLLSSYGAVEFRYTGEYDDEPMPPEEVMQLLGAIRAREVAWAESLLVRGAEAQCHSNLGYSALTLAARYGQLPMVQLLLDYGAAVDEPCIMRDAARSGHLDILRALLPFLRHRQKERALTLALYPAAARGRTDILQFLIDHGADVHDCYTTCYADSSTDYRSITCTITPLIYTIINNQRAAHDLLIAHGATYTPLYIP